MSDGYGHAPWARTGLPPNPEGVRSAPHPGYPAPPQPRQPSAVTGIVAATLAVIAGLVAGASAVVSLIVVADIDEHGNADAPDAGGLLIVIFVVVAAASAFLALLYLLGGALLFARLTVGRILVIIASVLGMLLAALFLGQEPGAVAIAVCALCFSTLLTASLPSTGRWIAAKKYLAQGPPNRRA